MVWAKQMTEKQVEMDRFKIYLGKFIDELDGGNSHND